mmetsp:Transcript_33655/g.95761  ORF Transcript_33655/g.95761 Transcript_33655/m.95761 type:complete len:316 (+) Transcript_33655:122-1069(+)
MHCGPAGGDADVAAWILVFVLSGIASPMLLTQIRYDFAPPAASLWPLLPYYLGTLLAGARAPPLSRAAWGRASQLFSLDVAGQLLTNLGLVTIGPPLYSIFYKSVTVFTGLLSVVCLPPASHPTRSQWMGMLVITSGLSIGCADALQHFSASELWGALLVIVGCAFFAGAAVASELFLGPGSKCLGPSEAAWAIGVEGLVAWTLWAVVGRHALPGSVGFWVLMLAMVGSNALHQAAWFLLVGRVGACTTAVLKAMQSVCLFAAASIAFCGRDSMECLTWAKAMSFGVVMAGVCIYSFQTSKGPALDSREREQLTA